MPTKVLKGKTPFEILFGQAPTYGHLRVFGSLCFMTTTKHGRDKFQARAKMCVFMGYPFGKKGYRVMELATSKFDESRDIVFHENIFPFAISAKNRTTFLNLAQNMDVIDDEMDRNITQHTVNDSVDSVPLEVSQPLRRSTRPHKLPNHLKDYVCCSSTHDSIGMCCTITNLSVGSEHTFGVTVAAASSLIVEPQNYWEVAADPGC